MSSRTKNRPKVSVVIPTHNRPELLPRAVQSVLKQTFQDFEIIIVDDGSTTPAKQALRAFSDPRICIIRHEQSRGGGATRNSGIEVAQGEFIVFLDDDDEWLPEKTEKQLAAFAEVNEEIGVVFNGVQAYDNATGQHLYTRLPGEAGVVAPLRRLLRRCYIWTSAVMVRADLLKTAGISFDEEFPKCQEWDLLLRLAKKTKFFAINEPLTRLNVLGENEHLGGASNIENIIRGHKMLIEKHRSEYGRHKKALSARYFEIAVMHRDKGDYKEAHDFFNKAWRLAPFNLVYTKHAIFSSLFKIYKTLKNIPFLGAVINFVRMVPQHGVIGHYHARRRDFNELKKIIFALYGIDSPALNYIEELRQRELFKKKFSFGHAGDFDVAILYVLIRTEKPEVVVETGVASGRSSAFILQALADNNKGRLYSIDLPQFYEGRAPGTYLHEGSRSELRGFVPKDREPGWLVPRHLRNRWELILEDSKSKLPKLVKRLGSIDLFFHDSDHSYNTMRFEFEETWPYIPKGGFMLSDDVSWNAAFREFLREQKPSYSHVYRNFGIARK